MKINKYYNNLKNNYLFFDIAQKLKKFQSAHPDYDIIKLGIGDVTRPLCPIVIDAMNKALLEMGDAKTFRGYSPEQGYDFLRQKICDYYDKFGVKININEVFISDGAKSDVGNIVDVLDKDNKVLVCDPVYPVYVDTNIMDNRKIYYIQANMENNFLPMPDYSFSADIIYICSPNNPTGAVYNREQLKVWVDYALKNDAIILFDSAYEAFIDDVELPHSIFEIDGADKCAIEFGSLSKTAGFTGVRCSYTIISENLVRDNVKLNALWQRRQSTKFNGVAYIVQRGAEAVFTDVGQQQIKESINYYKRNAKVISDTVGKLGLWHTGGKNSPYVWLKCPESMSSWKFFDFLLENAHAVGTPGVGFGNNGEGYFRLSAFGDYDKTVEAMDRIEKLLRN